MKVVMASPSPAVGTIFEARGFHRLLFERR
jgi:hypothetical protein